MRRMKPLFLFLCFPIGANPRFPENRNQEIIMVQLPQAEHKAVRLKFLHNEQFYFPSARLRYTFPKQWNAVETEASIRLETGLEKEIA